MSEITVSWPVPDGFTEVQLKADRKDPGWEYCRYFTRQDQSILVCKFCGKNFKGFAIHPVKQHLSGEGSTVCPTVPGDVKILIGLIIKRKRKLPGTSLNNAITNRDLLFNSDRGFFSETLSNNLSFPMRSYNICDLSEGEMNKIICRTPFLNLSSTISKVQPILDDVRIRGDIAVKHYSSLYDKVDLNEVVVLVNKQANPKIDESVRASFDAAYERIRSFHLAQKPIDRVFENVEGVKCERSCRSISSVGLYVPGGTTIQPSTLLVLAVPAQIAGCGKIVLATPTSNISKELLYCAKKCGVTHILKAGGAQAIAAMAWGTSSCPKVEKIFGHGNQNVEAAKMILQNSDAMVSVDMPSGPSEVVIILDEDAKPVYIAADLLSQAEHGPDCRAILVIVGDKVDVKAITDEILKQGDNLPRVDFAAKVISSGLVLFAKDIDEALRFSNAYAPQHLILNVHNAQYWVDYIYNAGSVYLGNWTPECASEFVFGTNRVPTYGYARMFSGLSVASFCRYITVHSLTQQGLEKVGPHVETFAEVEGLVAHVRALNFRLDDISKMPQISADADSGSVQL